MTYHCLREYELGPNFMWAELTWTESQELDVDMFSLLVRGKDGHFADAQIVSG